MAGGSAALATSTAAATPGQASFGLRGPADAPRGAGGSAETAPGRSADGVASPGGGISRSAKKPPYARGNAAPGELLVRFRPEAPEPQIDRVNRAHGAKTKRRYRSVAGLHLVSVPPEADVEALAASFRRDAEVLYAEPNYYVQTAALPDDELFGALWGLHQPAAPEASPDVDVNGPEAWDLTTGSEQSVVFVIDTGINYKHPDLVDNLWVNPGEIPGNAVDDDGNGYVDDVHGINVINDTGDPLDDEGHGTHVAGTIAARGNNGLGMAGVSWRSKIAACKFLDIFGWGKFGDSVLCFDYVLDLRTRTRNPVPVVATNNSWGGGWCPRGLHDAIARQRDAGILTIAAAGNNARDLESFEFCPAGYPLANVLVVGATDRHDVPPDFSNFGRGVVHLFAPGVDILSTTLGSGYMTLSGTSMATPHVSGLIALLHAQDPTRDWRALKNLAIAGGVPVDALKERSISGRRMRAADGAGVGSLTCSGQKVLRRLRPLEERRVMWVGETIELTALHIDCEAPAGEVPVQVAPLGETLWLEDDGRERDQAAGDGVYTLAWTAPHGGTFTFTFPDGDSFVVDAMRRYRQPQVLPESAWRTIEGVPVESDNGWMTDLVPPFPIRFGSHSGFQFARVSLQGMMSFDPDAWDIEPALPSSFSPTVAPFWDAFRRWDLEQWALIRHDVLGTAPNREWVVEWREVEWAQTDLPPYPTLTFQVVFHEGSAEVHFNYLDTFIEDANPANDGGTALVGMQELPTHATVYSERAPKLGAGMSLLWQVNTEPRVESLEASRPSVAEGETVEFVATFTDPDGAQDAPWRVELDLDADGPAFGGDRAVTLQEPGVVRFAHAWPQSGVRRVAVRVTDAAGAQSPVRYLALPVDNVAPTLAPVVASPAALAEGGLVTFTTRFDDPSAYDFDWSIEWDLDYDGAAFSADVLQRQMQPGEVSWSHRFDQNGARTVAARVVDRDGTVSEVRTVRVEVEDLAPRLTMLEAPSVVREGDEVAVRLALEDPGDGAAPWRIEIDWDHDGVLFAAGAQALLNEAGIAELRTVVDRDGPRRIAARALDADGSSSELLSFELSVEDVSPVVEAAVGEPTEGFEPRTVEFSVIASSGAVAAGVDAVRSFRWDFDGDGRFELLDGVPRAVHRYLDNPPAGDRWNAVVRVEDEDSSTDVVIPVVVRNTAPVLAAPPAEHVVIEGELFELQLTARDEAGVEDPLSWRLTGAPAGMRIDAGGRIAWVPLFAQTSGAGASYSVEATVTDDDGASAAAGFTVRALWRDGDGDGMPDGWESAHGSDPALSDASADSDGDGLSNDDEWRMARDGLQAPGAVQPVVPREGAQIRDANAELVVQNALDADSSSLEIRFVVAVDPAFAQPVWSATVPQDPAGQTLVVVEASALVEDRSYFWRARACDPTLCGLWSPGRRFVFNREDALPTAPWALLPLEGARVEAAPLTLAFANARDGDGDALQYEAVLALDSGFFPIVASRSVPENSDGRTVAIFDDAELKPNTRYWWRVRASDGIASGAWSEPRQLLYRPDNFAPSMPLPLVPLDGARIEVVAGASLVVLEARDPEADPLTYEFQVAHDALFADVSVTSQAAAGVDGRARLELEAATLESNRRYWWRARAADAAHAGPWSEPREFHFLPANGAPTAPLLVLPLHEAPVPMARPALTVYNARDPDGDPLRVEFVVARDAAFTDVAASSMVVEDVSGQTSLQLDSAELAPATRYWWRARASDATSDGPWSEARSFEYLPANRAPLAPVALAPAGGAAVTGVAVLTFASPRDPESDPLQCEVVVSSHPDFAEVVFRSLGPPESSGPTVVAVDEASLIENTRYWWRARANDGSSAGPWSVPEEFHYRPVNGAPGAPWPLGDDGALVSGGALRLSVANARDPEADPLVYEFEWSEQASLTRASRAEVAADSSGITSVAIAAEALRDDATYWWRARARDAGSKGPWSLVSRVRYSSRNSPPAVPQPLSPALGMRTLERRPLLVALNARDPEDDPLQYEFEVREQTADGALVSAGQIPEAPQGATPYAVPVELSSIAFVWRVRAMDPEGAASEWSEPVLFRVAIPEVLVQPGCCSAARGAAAIGSVWPGLLLALALRRRRVRRGG